MTYKYKYLFYLMLVVNLMFFLLFTHVYGRWFLMTQKTNITTTTVSQICNMFDAIKPREVVKNKIKSYIPF